MLKQIGGIHHITSVASDAIENNRFFTQVLGLRRVKKTVNFDVPDVYHLYYGDEVGSPGSAITYFPYPDINTRTRGSGEISVTAFSIPKGALSYWQERLSSMGVENLRHGNRFGDARLEFTGPDGEGLAVVEVENDERRPWTGNGVDTDVGIRGFHSASMSLKEDGALRELLVCMNYEVVDSKDGITRLAARNGNGADIIDLETVSASSSAQQGAGSVHHIALAVESDEDQIAVRQALKDTGYAVTPVIDRNYFHSIYFRVPDGILFEVATNEPGFTVDEDATDLGQALKLPEQHAHLRDHLEKSLPTIDN